MQANLEASSEENRLLPQKRVCVCVCSASIWYKENVADGDIALQNQSNMNVVQ